MDIDEDVELRRITGQIRASNQIVDETAAMCDGIVGQAESLTKKALDRAVIIGGYNFKNAQEVMGLFCERAASLRAALSSRTRSDAFFAAQAALDMTGIALAIGERLPPDELIKLAKAGFAQASRNQENARKSAKVRNADDTWKPHALELAEQIQSEGEFTQQRIADLIKERWKLRIPCPQSMLIKQIRDWQNAGQLKKRPRNR